MSKLQAKTLYYLAILFWIAILFFDDQPLTKALLKPSSIVLPILIIIVIVFEKWIWKWRFLYPWFVSCPNIQGSWIVKLQSTWIDPNTNKQMDPFICYMIIRQTLTTLSIRLLSEKSQSKLLAHSFIYSNDGVHQLAGIYLNTPRIEQRGKKSEIHYGALLLDVNGGMVQTIEGHYWTDRETCGHISLYQRKAQLYKSYDEAQAGFHQ